jgi:hypothetical protein
MFRHIFDSLLISIIKQNGLFYIFSLSDDSDILREIKLQKGNGNSLNSCVIGLSVI